MKERVDRWFKIISITVIITLLVFCIYAPFVRDPQKERREKAKPFLPVVEEMLAKDSRFANVKAEVNYDGAISFVGEVRSEHDLTDLKEAVKAKSLPVMVLWRVDPFGMQGAK